MPRAVAALLALAGALAGPACRRGRTPAEEVASGPAAGSSAAPPDGFLAAPVVDSHVHLVYWPVADRLAAAGIAAAVDLAAPIDAIGSEQPITVLWAGPMLTRPGGYPIDAWDPGGFGAGCDARPCVDEAVETAAARGARVIKIAFGDDGLAPELARAAVEDAHRHGLPVAAHALTDDAARAAADAGCDLLAHTPVTPLSDATVAAWSKRAVISTLAAFGGGPDAVDNLRRLRAAGATVLYGTDLGNSRVAGVDPDELKLLGEAGLDGPAIVDAMTTTPVRYWKLEGLAGDPPGPEGSYVVLARDPRQDPTAYVTPVAVYLRGRLLR
ncbi:MAG TPA: hypothetical protein VHE35_11175 [Kofleriaceae bacterium]|nr:hypothetical protein [Kofleriaceae bacterium]